MAEHEAEILAELRKQTAALARWEGSKGLFGGLCLVVFVGIIIAGMTAGGQFSSITIWAPLALPVLFGWAGYSRAYNSVANPKVTTQQQQDGAREFLLIILVGAAVVGLLVWGGYWHHF